MTEIPEHLLKRSRERRAALGLGGGEAPEAPAPAEAAPAAESTSAPAATAAPATRPEPVIEARAPEPPKPEPAYIQAAKQRRRIPYWAMPVLAALPLWGYVFVRTLEPPPSGEDDPFALGAEVFSADCASCHGGGGEGAGGAPAFVDGAVQETWPNYRDHMAWVRLGTNEWPADTYGATAKPVGGGGTMPTFSQLSDQQLAQVVLHERTLGDPEEITEDNPDFANLFAIARGEKTFAQVLEEDGLGPVSQEAGVTADMVGG